MLDRLRDQFPLFVDVVDRGKGDPIEHVLPGATADEIDTVESAVGLQLPVSYRNFLRITRGFWLMGGPVQFRKQYPSVHDFPKLEEPTPPQQQVVTAKGGRWPPPNQGMLCFAEFFLEADGDQVLFDVSAGLIDCEYPVVYYAHEDRPPSVRRLADNFSSFLSECLSYEEWG